MAHFHNPSEPNQNLGNRLGQNSCIRMSQAGRAYDSGNEMKGILGNPNTSWDVEHKEGAYLGQHVAKAGADLTEKIGGERRQGFVSAARKSKTADITGKVGGREERYEQPQMDRRAPAHYQGESLEADPRMEDPRMGEAADLGRRPVAGQIQSQLQRPKNDRTDQGNPLSWGDNDAWQTTSSNMGGFYRR